MITDTQTELVEATTGSSLVLQTLADEAHQFFNAASAPSTRLAQEKDWADFARWCENHVVASLPADPATVILYATDLARRLKMSTITRRLSSIASVHRRAGLISPTHDVRVKEVIKGMRRSLGVAAREASPLTITELRKISYALGDSLLDTRDRALLLVGFAGAFRRSELVGLRIDDLERSDEGVVALIRRSKTDQEGRGRRVALPLGHDPLTCPVAALQSWFAMSGIDNGPAFRPLDRHGNVGPRSLSEQAVALIVKRRVAAIGLDPALFSGHSVRAGFVTTAAMAGASERSIAAQSGHTSIAVLRRYVRRGTIFADNAVSQLGL